MNDKINLINRGEPLPKDVGLDIYWSWFIDFHNHYCVYARLTSGERFRILVTSIAEKARAEKK